MTKVQNLKTIVLTAIISAVLVTTSGCGSKDGFAPSGGPATTIITNGTAVYLKNGSTVLTSNGWNLSLDATDPISNLTTTNGWKVEVKYE